MGTTSRQADNLCDAAADWASMASARINDPDKSVALSTCMIMPGAEIRVVAKLREGVLVLEGAYEGKCRELYREDIAPLRVMAPIGGDVVDPPVHQTLVKTKMLEPIRTETRVPGDGGEVLKVLADALAR
jgi:hypothetical protein